MLQRLIIIFFIFQLSFSFAQTETPTMSIVGKGAIKGYFFYPAIIDQNKPLVIFLHGYGISNPKLYGGWINNLNQHGYTVLFPKYQYGIEPPRSNIYKNRINELLQIVYELDNHSYDTLFFIGHSIGGVIAANLADDISANGEKIIKGLMLVSPGHKKFNQGEYKEYENLRAPLNLLVITGKEDNVAKTRFSNHIMYSSNNLTNKVFIEFDKEKPCKTTSKHGEALSPLNSYSTINLNLFNNIAKLIGKIDSVDTDLLWPLSLSMIGYNHSIDFEEVFEKIEFPFVYINPRDKDLK